MKALFFVFALMISASFAIETFDVDCTGINDSTITETSSGSGSTRTAAGSVIK